MSIKDMKLEIILSNYDQGWDNTEHCMYVTSKLNFRSDVLMKLQDLRNKRLNEYRDKYKDLAELREPDVLDSIVSIAGSIGEILIKDALFFSNWFKPKTRDPYREYQIIRSRILRAYSEVMALPEDKEELRENYMAMLFSITTSYTNLTAELRYMVNALVDIAVGIEQHNARVRAKPWNRFKRWVFNIMS